MDFATIWTEAEAAGLKAMRDFSQRYPANLTSSGFYDGGACGFAWITIRPARGKFVSWCKEQNRIATEKREAELGRRCPVHTFGDNGWNGGWVLWQPGSKEYNGQSVAMYETAATAFNEVLRSYGIEGSVGSKLD